MTHTPTNESRCSFKKVFNLVGAIFFAFALTFSACTEDEEPDENADQELITTIRIQVLEHGTTDTTTYEWRDADGDGGNLPSIDTIKLKTNTTYSAFLTLLDESKTEPIDMTSEIKEEGDEHLFAFTPSGANLSINITDKDEMGLPLGLESEWQTITAEGNKTLTIVLKHQPDEKTGDISLGETDVNIALPYRID